jgi:hypothetical protein
MILALLGSGSVGMVWLHEFGHLLQGHLHSPESHQIELDADRFAFTLYAHVWAANPNGIWYCLGALTVLVVIDIIETVNRIEETKSHPSARRRLSAAVNIHNRTDPKQGAIGYYYICALATLISPTLRRKWNVTLDYSA